MLAHPISIRCALVGRRASQTTAKGQASVLLSPSLPFPNQCSDVASFVLLFLQNIFESGVTSRTL